MPKIQIPGYLCTRCDHTWVPRVPETPATCPKCKSAFWDRPRKREVRDETA